MATDLDEVVAPEEEAPQEELEIKVGPKFSLKDKKVRVIALLVVVMTVQSAAIYFLLPQPAVSGTGTDGGDDLAVNGDSENLDLEIEKSEQEIGDLFSCTNSRADERSVIHVTFRLVATVATKQKEASNLAVNEVHKHRVKQAVVKVARSSGLEDLNDAGLETMKRRKKEEINKILKTSYIIEIIISDFRTMQQ